MQTSVRRLMLLVSALLVMCTALIATAQAKPQGKHATPSVSITAKQAEGIALKKFPGKIVEKTKLENEEGVMQYGVMVKSGKTLREVMVNAKTGKIDSVEVTTASTEKKEAAQEKVGAKSKPQSKAGAKTK